jgi:pimeloyl-ACP methyl ester carboxylesterase
MTRPAVRRAALTTVLLCLAAATLAAQTPPATKAPPFEAPGRLIDIGGWRLHLNCAGMPSPGQPTVILEAGAGDFSAEWSLVQPGVAKFARVCSYDRANSGWSDWGPHPRTMHQMVYELHALLEKAAVAPPVLLVGHSYGGWLVRLYRLQFPADVAGMVLVESGADDPVRVLSDGVPRHASDLVTGKTIPPVKTAGPLREEDLSPGVRAQMEAATRQFAWRANEPPRNKLPAETQQVRTWALSQIKHWAQSNNPVEPEELALLRAERAKTEQPYRDMPLAVLTRGISDADGPDSKALEAEHRRDHAGIAKLSSAGKLVIAEKSGHHVQIDEPELVISTIRDMLLAAGRR